MDTCIHSNFWNGDGKSKYNNNQKICINKKEKTLSDFLPSFLHPISPMTIENNLIYEKPITDGHCEYLIGVMSVTILLN
jgi:hypothetical protein